MEAGAYVWCSQAKGDEAWILAEVIKKKGGAGFAVGASIADVIHAVALVFSKSSEHSAAALTAGSRSRTSTQVTSSTSGEVIPPSPVREQIRQAVLEPRVIRPLLPTGEPRKATSGRSLLRAQPQGDARSLDQS